MIHFSVYFSFLISPCLSFDPFLLINSLSLCLSVLSCRFHPCFPAFELFSYLLIWLPLSSLTVLVLHSIMFLQFVPKTHLFFTAGKDKKIKQWDADKFEHIQTLEVTLFSMPLTFRVRWLSPRVLSQDSFTPQMLKCKISVVADIWTSFLPYRATIGRSGVWPSAPAATTLCRHPTTSPCACGKEPENPSSWRRNGRWWDRTFYRCSDTHLKDTVSSISYLNCFCFHRSERQSLRRAWPKETCLWWVLRQHLYTFHQTLSIYEWYAVASHWSGERFWGWGWVNITSQTSQILTLLCSDFKA